MLRKSDSARFATFRMRVLAALTEGEQEPVYQVTQQRAQQVWTNTAKAATRSLEGGSRTGLTCCACDNTVEARPQQPTAHSPQRVLQGQKVTVVTGGTRSL